MHWVSDREGVADGIACKRGFRPLLSFPGGSSKDSLSGWEGRGKALLAVRDCLSAVYIYEFLTCLANFSLIGKMLWKINR